MGCPAGSPKPHDLVAYFGITYSIVLSLWLSAFALLSGMLRDRLDRAGTFAADSSLPKQERSAS